MHTTYLKHPLHGATVVYDRVAFETHLKNGWVLDENQPEGAPGPVKAEPVVGVDKDGDGVIDQVFKRKPGRPKKGD